MSYLGLDIGTTGCKAAVFDEDGKLLALAYREYPLLSPQPAWAELDSDRVCADCFDVIREAAAKCADDPVRAMGISCQGEAFTPVDERGRMLARGMVSSDARALPQVQSFAREIDSAQLYAITGHTPHPMFTLYKMLWLRENRPEMWKQIERFHCYEDLFHARLGIEPAMSWPLAGRTMLFDVRRHQWSGEILAATGVEKKQLPRTLAAGEIAGAIGAAAAAELGLARGALVVTGGHDQPCGALGAGVTAPGVAMYASGTVECICPAFAEPRLDDGLMRGNLCTYDYTLPGMYTTVAFSITGGNLLRWFRDQWGQIEVEQAQRSGADPYTLLMEAMADQPTDLLVLPYFTPSGTPYFDATLPGAILGLRLSTTRGEVLRSLIEGVAMEMRLNLHILDEAGLATRELRAIGGGARSKKLVQLKASVLHRPITTLAVTEAACLGAAILACAAHRQANAADVAASWVRPVEIIEPDPQQAAQYDEQFAKYRRLYPVMSRAWGEING